MYVKTYTFLVGDEEISTENFIKRYHFDENDKELIKSTGIFLAGVITITAAICYQQERTVCAVTLGKRYDELEALVEESGNLLLSYCMECVGMEFLSKAYAKMNEAVFQETGKWMGEYHFLDSDKLDSPKELEAVLEEEGIQWKNGMLHPLKSVLFTAEYRENKTESGCHSCEQCNNLTCSFRELSALRMPVDRNEKIIDKSRIYSYGISRILENQQEENMGSRMVKTALKSENDSTK